MWHESINQYGYAIIPNVIPQDEIGLLITTIENSNLNRTRAGARHILKQPVINELANDPRLLKIAESVLCKTAIPFRATLFDKSPNANWLVTWHQDTALPLLEKKESAGWGPWSAKDGIIYAHAPTEALDQVLALRVHLDDSIAENGPLRVIPGSHKHGVLTDMEVEELASKSQPVDCLVPKCGVIAMRPLIIHASSKSISDVPRRVIHIEYATSLSITQHHQLALA